jgi:hypothetical protein
MCDDGLTPPRSGALWVIYIKQQDGKAVETLSYPLEVVRYADATLGPISETDPDYGRRPVADGG